MPFAIARLKMGSLPDCTGNIPIRPNSQTEIDVDHGSCSLFGDAAQYHNLICNARLLSYFFLQSVTERTASMLHSKLMS